MNTNRFLIKIKIAFSGAREELSEEEEGFAGENNENYLLSRSR